jgi:hypothetical protein
MKRDTKTNNDLQNTTQKTKDQATLTPIEIEVKLMCSGRVTVPVPHY